jgi:hypothetical protein
MKAFKKLVQFASIIIGPLAVFVLLTAHVADSALILMAAAVIVLLLSIGAYKWASAK